MPGRVRIVQERRHPRAICVGGLRPVWRNHRHPGGGGHQPGPERNHRRILRIVAFQHDVLHEPGERLEAVARRGGPSGTHRADVGCRVSRRPPGRWSIAGRLLFQSAGGALVEARPGRPGRRQGSTGSRATAQGHRVGLDEDRRAGARAAITSGPRARVHSRDTPSAGLQLRRRPSSRGARSKGCIVPAAPPARLTRPVPQGGLI